MTKFEKEIEQLMDNNQALKAWELIKDTDHFLKGKVWQKVKHAFEPSEYRKYYKENLVEHPVDEQSSVDCSRLAPRFAWLVSKLVNTKYKTVADLGCADGYTCLTLAKMGFECVGVNLYAPSVEIANQRAESFGLNAKFIEEDLLEYKGEHDVVVLFEVLEHLPDPEKAIEHAYSLVKPGGSLYLSTPRDDHIGIELHLAEKERKGWDDGMPSGHLRLWSEQEFKGMLENYEIVEFYVDSDRNMMAEIVKRDPYRVCYTSSYDRGLEHLLTVWPEVKSAVPEANLHVYYGWDLFAKFYGDNPERMAWMSKINQLLEQDGITHHGRVSQPQIVKEMKKCGIWAYPTHFGEISCISAMKAQACGAVPVVIDYAALNTTVQYGKKIDGDIYDRETKDLFKRVLIELLKSPEEQEIIRKDMISWALEYFQWSRVAKQWSDEFRGLLVENLIPRKNDTNK